jgi:hypothetical protein
LKNEGRLARALPRLHAANAHEKHARGTTVFVFVFVFVFGFGFVRRFFFARSVFSADVADERFRERHVVFGRRGDERVFVEKARG